MKADAADERATGPQRALQPSSFLSLPKEGRERLERAFEALPQAVFVAWTDREPLQLNAAADALLGLEAGDHLRSVADFDAVIRASSGGRPLAPEESPLARALGGASIDRLELQVCLRDEEVRTWIVDARPILEDDVVVGALCTCRDVTERRLDDEMADELLGRAAHDLRTPLTALKASAQLLGRGFERLDAAARTRTLTLLLTQVERLSTRIDEVLDASRIRRGRVDVQAERVDVTALLTELSQTLGASPSMPPCTFEIAESLIARTDPSRLRQVVTKLVVEAGARLSPEGRVIVRARAGDAKVSIEVTGEQAPRENRARTARRLARTILSRLSGDVRDEGSTVKLELPAEA